MSKRFSRRKKEIQRAESERHRRKREIDQSEQAEPDAQEAGGEKEDLPVPERPRRPLRVGHVALILAFGVFAAGYYWLGREMFARYRLNVIRYPQLTGNTQQITPDKQRFHLEKAVAVFPCDGVLQMELARRIYEQRDLLLYGKAIEHNDLAFQTHFDVNAYKQRAWIHAWLSEVEAKRGRNEAAAQHLRDAIDKFELVLLLNPSDTEALERLAYIHSREALHALTQESWERSIDYAKRLLDEEHDNTNALYFLGVAYDNLGIKERAAQFYLRVLEMEPISTMTRKKLWDRNAILEHLKNLRFIPEIPEDRSPP